MAISEAIRPTNEKTIQGVFLISSLTVTNTILTARCRKPIHFSFDNPPVTRERSQPPFKKPQFAECRGPPTNFTSRISLSISRCRAFPNS
ncbi:hypothetical protein TNCV_2421891 [Trichonephila clavipes]|nr:hypothetical protein TNCV_2421891 [Trichonephila clavipes]